MSLGEAWRLTLQLGQDPSSAVAAALARWDHPLSREALLLADLFDLEHTVNARTRPKPHPMRPFTADDRQKRHLGNTAGRTRPQVLAILQAARAGRAG